MQLVKVISSEYDKAKKRLIKITRFGKNDTQTALEAMPFGVDSNPIKDMIAVYGATSETGKEVIIGYLNKDQLSEPGEIRLFSTNSNGDLQFYTWLKSNGTLELGGDDDNLVRYQKLKDGLDSFIVDLKSEFTLIQTAIASLGGSYTPNPTLEIDIEDSKIEEIKTL